MTSKFNVALKEPADNRTPSGIGFALEFEFSDRVAGLSGDTVMLYLNPNVTLDQAEQLASSLNRLGEKIAVTNVR